MFLLGLFALTGIVFSESPEEPLLFDKTSEEMETGGKRDVSGIGRGRMLGEKRSKVEEGSSED